MSNNITPALYASIANPPHVNIKPELYASVETPTSAETKWRYENAGFREKITRYGINDYDSSHSRTGVAFYQTVQIKNPLFPIEDATELWIKFDVYSDGTTGWSFWNYSNSKHDGLSFTDGHISIIIGGNIAYASSCPTSGLHTYTLHMRLGYTTGVCELWCDGNFVHSINGINSLKLNRLYCYTSGSGSVFSNIIITNSSLLKNGEVVDTVLDASKQWRQPIISSNGTFGTSELAVTSVNLNSYAYRVFNSNTEDYLNKTNEDASVTFCVPEPIIIKALYLHSPDEYLPAWGKFLYSDDGETYVECGEWHDSEGVLNTCARVVISEPLLPHRYFRITPKSRANGKSGNADIGNINIDAVYQTGSPHDNDGEFTIFTLNADVAIQYDTQAVIDADTEIEYEQGTRFSINGDTATYISNEVTKNFDTAMQIQVIMKPFKMNSDVRYNVQNGFEDDADTAIAYYQGAMQFESNYDTVRHINLPFENQEDIYVNFVRMGHRYFDMNVTFTNVADFHCDTDLDFLNDKYKVLNENFDTKMDIYKQITDTYGIVICKEIDLGKSYTVEVAISVEGAGFAQIRYSNNSGAYGSFVDYIPEIVTCRYIQVALVIRDRVTAAKISVMPVPREVTINEHVPVKGKTVSYGTTFFGTPMIFPAANQYSVRVSDVTEEGCFVRLFDGSNPVEGDVSLLIKR